MADMNFMRYGMPLPWTPPVSSNSNTGSVAMDNTARQRIAWRFMPQELISCTSVGFFLGSTTGTVPLYRIGIQALNTSGDPDGTFIQSATLTPAGTNTYIKTTITGVQFAADTKYAVVLERNDQSFDASNFITVVAGHAQLGARNGNHGYLVYNAGTWGEQSSSGGYPVFSYHSASRSYGMPFAGFFTGTFNSNTAEGSGGAERGGKFTIPGGVGDTFKIAGIEWIGRNGAAANTYDVTIYEGTTSRQSKTGIDTDAAQAQGATDNQLFQTYFNNGNGSSLYTFSCGTEYTIGIKAGGTSTAMSLHGIEVAASADRKCFGGLDMSWAYRTGSGAFVDLTTRYPLLWLILADITEPAGGGGGNVVLLRRG
jgi:predicted outer membrane repeat protein